MNLYLVRHAAAVDRGAGITEEQRYLTPEGRVFFRKTARTMRKQGIDPSLILTSPLLRAVQTAEILAETLDFTGPVVATDELAPGFDIRKLKRLLDEYRTDDELVIVGHEPDLSTLAASLLAGSAGMGLKKGAALKFKLAGRDPGIPAEFKWLAVGRKLVSSPEEL